MANRAGKREVISRSRWLITEDKQASKHIYLLTQVRVSGSSTADVDLQLVPPELIFYNKYPGYSFTDLGRMDS